MHVYKFFGNINFDGLLIVVNTCCITTILYWLPFWYCQNLQKIIL